VYQPINENQVIAVLEGYGFEVKGKYIKKRNSQNKLEGCGSFNDHSVYFYASSNIYPFDPGISYSFQSIVKGFNTPLVSDYELQRIAAKRIQDKAAEKPKKLISFDEYLKTTNDNHNFNLQYLLDSFHKNKVNNLIHVPTVWENENNVKAKYNKTYFPVINKENIFVTAQIIQYKTDLKRNRETNIYYLPANGNIGLYRRNLYDETKPTIIVESPKLAELGALILPKINWFATFGKERLSNLDLNFLDPKTTYLLPDVDAFDDWQEVGINKFNFKIVDLFQKEITKFSSEVQKEYSDFADLILQYLQCKNDYIFDSVFYTIYTSLVYLVIGDEELLQQCTPEVDAYDDTLNFKEKAKKKLYFRSSIPKDFSINTGGYFKNTSQGGYNIKTKYFEVYTQDFEVISASFDICKEQTEKDFIENLERCFRVLRYLNNNTYLALFEKVLSNIQANGNYQFNQRYIYSVLLEQWEQIDPTYIDDLIKVRNYNYLGGANFTNYEFLDELRKAKKLYTIHSQLHAIQETVKKGIERPMYIDKKQLAITRKKGNEYIFDLIDRFNIASIGGKEHRYAAAFNKIVHNNVTSITTTIKGYDLMYKPGNITIYSLSKELEIHRKTLNLINSFKRDPAAIQLIYDEIDFLISNPLQFDINKIEVNGKFFNSVAPILPTNYNSKEITDFQDIAAPEKPLLNVYDAFLVDPTPEAIQKGFKGVTMDQSILNCSFEIAKQSGAEFYLSWFLFNNSDTPQDDREYLWLHRQDFYQDKFQYLKAAV